MFDAFAIVSRDSSWHIYEHGCQWWRWEKGTDCVWNEINMQKLLDSKGSKNHCRFSQKHLSRLVKICSRNRKVMAGVRFFIEETHCVIHDMGVCEQFSKCLMFEIPTVRKSFFFSLFFCHLFQFSIFPSVFSSLGFYFKSFPILWDTEQRRQQQWLWRKWRK